MSSISREHPVVRAVECCVDTASCCAEFNKLYFKISLLALGILFIGLGAYGLHIAPNMWGSYVVIGLGAIALLTDVGIVSYGLLWDCVERVARSSSQNRDEAAPNEPRPRIGRYLPLFGIHI